MKSDKTIIRKTLMEQPNFITNLVGVKDKNMIILDYKDLRTHKELIGKLDHPAPKHPYYQGQMAKYNFQKESKIPYLECAEYKTHIRLKKRHFRYKVCRKIDYEKCFFNIRLYLSNKRKSANLEDRRLSLVNKNAPRPIRMTL